MMNLEDSLRARPTKASESWHLKRSFSSPPVTSAQACRGRRCGGDLWRGSRESEQVAKQVASAQTTSAAAEALAHITEETHDLPLFDRR